MKKFKTFSSALAMLICFVAMAQEGKVSETAKPMRTLTGTVREKSTSDPLPGVAVTVKGTKRGVQTDINGSYAIQAKKGESLEFSFIGMKRLIKKVADADKIDVWLEEDNTTLQEVVVTGYDDSAQKFRVSNRKDKKPKAAAEAVKSLQGRVAGVAMANTNGVPSPSPTIRIRGENTLKGSNAAVYVVDGVPVSEKEFSQISPESIGKVTMLGAKDATALYGNRAAGGIVVVDTKNAKPAGLSKTEFSQRLDALYKAQKQPVTPSDEAYDAFVENPFESPKNAALSTFSIDVDNASYTNIRRFLNNGQTVPKDAVRIEEMVNFFKYQYPQPTGPHPFSINTEYSDCPWNAKHKLVRIGLQGKNIDSDALPASNLVFLIDVSGSMSDPNKLPLVKESLKLLANELRSRDKVAIVVYAGAAGMVLPPTRGSDKKAITQALDNLSAGGSTAGGAGIELAYKLAQENFIKGGNNRVILATDGDFNVGVSANSDMETLITEKRKSGVFLTCLGYGMGNYKDSKMEILADKGNGNYAYIDNIQEANRFLGKEFKGSMYAIAKDVKIQIEFNPKQVQAYRLIGYENRKLRPEDFTNDAIDAGELGSGHTVTALYEIVPDGVQSEFYSDAPALKYTKTEPFKTSYDQELATVKFRYKKPDGDKSTEMVQVISAKAQDLAKASDDFRFGAAVAWFGLKLRDSKLLNDKSTDVIVKLARTGLSNDADGYKAEFVRLAETQKDQL